MKKSQGKPIDKKVGSQRVLKRERTSLAEVRQLVSSAREGDVKARKQLLDAYSYLPLHLATLNRASATQLPQAIKVGVEALHIAIDQYQLNDPEHLTCYIRRRVNSRIKSYLEHASLPKNAKGKVQWVRVRKHKQKMDGRTEALRALGKQLRARTDAREYTIIEHRYGLNGHVPKSLGKVAELVGVSRQRVHRIECRAIARLLGDETK